MYHKSFEHFRTNYLQLIPLTIILQTCIASIAVLYLLKQPPTTGIMVQLAIGIYAASFYNGAIIAQLPVKTVYNLLLASNLINILLIIVHA
jgi:hypothetical protein